MAQLNHILGSVMRDIILAQHEANLYSYVLSEQYGKDGKTRDFPLPGVNISDIEMTLRYAVLDNVDNSEQYYITYDKLTKFRNGLCDAVAQKTIAIMENYILTNGLQTAKGQDPHGIAIPAKWQWPTERTCIKDAYPDFNTWASDRTQATDWYLQPVASKVVK